MAVDTLEKGKKECEPQIQKLVQEIETCQQAMESTQVLLEKENLQKNLKKLLEKQRILIPFYTLQNIVFPKQTFESLMNVNQRLLPHSDLTIREALEEASTLSSAQNFLADYVFHFIQKTLEIIFQNKNISKKDQHHLEECFKYFNLEKVLQKATRSNLYLSLAVIDGIQDIFKNTDWKKIADQLIQHVNQISFEKYSLPTFLGLQQKFIFDYFKQISQPIYTINQAAYELLSAIQWNDESSLNLKNILETGYQYFFKELQDTLRHISDNKLYLNEICRKSIQENTFSEIIKILWDLGAHPNTPNEKGETAFEAVISLKRDLNQKDDQASTNMNAIITEINARWPNLKIAQKNTYQSLLEFALLTQNISRVESLLKEGTIETFKAKIGFNFWKDLNNTRKYDRPIRQVFDPLIKRHPKLNWLITLDTFLLTIADPNKSIKVLKGGVKDFYWLHPEAKRQLFEAAHQFKKISNNYGRHAVLCLEVNGRKLFFKQYPELPGIEYAVGEFTRLFIDVSSAPYVELLKFKEGKISYPVLISSAIEGINFYDVARHQTNLLKQLDFFYTSKAILLSPEDGKFDNFIVSPVNRKENYSQYQLISVDNDHAFVQGVVEDKGKQKLQLKTALFCLDNMLQTIPKDVRTSILALNIENFLEKWIEKLLKENKKHFQLFGQEQHDLLTRPFVTLIGVPFRANAFKALYDKMYGIKELLKRAPHLSHMDILHALNPLVAQRYQEAFKKVSTAKLIDPPRRQIN